MSGDFVPHEGFADAREIADGTPLKSAEIARFIRTIDAEVFQSDDNAPRRSEASFQPKSLLDMAREASERARLEAEAAKPDIIPEPEAVLEPEQELGEDLSVPEAADEPEAPLELEEAVVQTDSVEAEKNGDVGEDIPEPEPAAGASEDAAALEAAVQEAFERGRAEGQQQAQNEVEAMMSHALGLLEQCVVAFTAGAETESKALAASIEASVISLASARAGTQIDKVPRAFAARIEELADRVQSSVASPILKLHPSDLAVVQPMLEQSCKLLNLRLVASNTLQRGDIDMTLEGIRLTDMMPRIDPPASITYYEPLSLADDAVRAQTPADAPVDEPQSDAEE